MSRYNRFSIRFLMMAVLIVAVALGVLRIPDSRSAHFIDHVQAGRIDDVLSMIMPERDDAHLSLFDDFLRTQDVSVSTQPLDFADYFRCVRTVYVSSGQTHYEFAVGLFSVEYISLMEPLVSRGDF